MNLKILIGALVAIVVVAMLDHVMGVDDRVLQVVAFMGIALVGGTLGDRVRRRRRHDGRNGPGNPA